eukprot:2673425-Rhodomonas_salina.1
MDDRDTAPYGQHSATYRQDQSTSTSVQTEGSDYWRYPGLRWGRVLERGAVLRWSMLLRFYYVMSSTEIGDGRWPCGSVRGTIP